MSNIDPCLLATTDTLTVAFNQLHLCIGRPPSTINSIDIVNGTVDVVTSTILLNITWEPPYPYGELQYYELQLTGEVNGTANGTFGGQRFPVRFR